MTPGYVLGLIKDPKLNPFYLFREVRDHTIYNFTTLGMTGRYLHEYSRSFLNHVLTYTIDSFNDFNDGLNLLISHNIEDAYIIVDKFDMVADMARKSFNRDYQKYAKYERDVYREVIIDLLKLDNKLILVTKPRQLYAPDGTKLDSIGLSGLRHTEVWCNDISYFKNTDPLTLTVRHHFPAASTELVEPTIQQIEEVLFHESNETTNQAATD